MPLKEPIQLNIARESILEHSLQDYQPCWSCRQDDSLPWSWFRCSFPWYVNDIFTSFYSPLTDSLFFCSLGAAWQL